MINQPLVSVCITAYNHEKYLAEALDSVLSQKVDFEFEVLIGEDYSTDSTLKIALAYQAKFPSVIKVVQSGRLDKLVINGQKTGRYNWLNILHLAKGRYIALLDGDDYWIDPCKLQKQLDFLVQNQDYALIFHNVYLSETVSDTSRNLSKTYHPRDFWKAKDLEKLLLSENIVPTSAAMLRNNIPKVFPDLFYKVQIGDWPFQVFNLNFGKIKYMEETMGVYRVGAGIWSKKGRATQLLVIIDTYKYMGEITPPGLAESLKRACAIHYRELIRQYKGERKLLNAAITGIHLCRFLVTGKIAHLDR